MHKGKLCEIKERVERRVTPRFSVWFPRRMLMPLRGKKKKNRRKRKQEGKGWSKLCLAECETPGTLGWM